MGRTSSIIGITVLAAIFGLAGSAMANGGMMGGGSMMGSGMMGGGSGFGQEMLNFFQGRTGGMNRDRGNDRSQSRAERLQQARDHFFDASHRLRANIKEKQSILKEEQSKKTPDPIKVTHLQNELSRMQSEYDQQLSDYERETRDISANGPSGNGADDGYGYGPRNR